MKDHPLPNKTMLAIVPISNILDIITYEYDKTHVLNLISSLTEIQSYTDRLVIFL